MANLLEELLAPISDASFCGEDGSYEADFEAAKAEAEKITENDFSVMAEASRRFLTRKSKDMRALGYLTLGSGLAVGLDAFSQAVQAYCHLVMERWEDIHPKRPVARSNALKWLNGERNLALLAGVTGSGDYESLQAAYEALVKLQTFVEGKFPDAPPAFLGFIKQVKDFAERNKPREQAPTQPSGSPSQAQSPSQTQTQAQTQTTPSGPAGPAVIASADDAVLAIQNGGYYLLEQDRSNPLPYRLARILKWGNIQGNLPSDNGRTTLPAPYPHVLEGFRDMAQNQRWPDIVASGEEAFSSDTGVLWLDLQRYLCTAMQALGGNHAACSRAIRVELALLLQRAPDLPVQGFEDGTPFADALTKDWIQADVMPVLGSGGGSAAMAVKRKGDIGEEQKQAETLLGEGKLDQAIHILRTGMVNDSSEKNNFDRKLIMAELCFKGNKPNIAKALLEDLSAAIEHHDLSKWDPELCVTVYHLSQKVYLGLAEAAEDHMRPDLRERAVAMHTQIARLNPVLAISADFK